MDEDVAHIYYLSPRHFIMLISKIFGKHIGCLAYYHYIINDSMITHDV